VVSVILLAAAAAVQTPAPTPTATSTATRTPTPHPYAVLYLGSEPFPTPTAAPGLAGFASQIKLKGKRVTDRPDTAGGPLALLVTQKYTGPQSDAGQPAVTDEQAIKERCATQWPGDYRMQVYCVEQETKALRNLAERKPADVPVEVFSRIRSACQKEWPLDPRMQDYCERQELEAWRKLHKGP